jgi:hypothetical protein
MKTFTIILLILLTIKANSQIPNNEFENWRNVGNCIEPTSWYSFYSLIDSSGSYCPVTRSTDHYPTGIGSYSVRIANDTAIWNSGIIPNSFLGWGMLSSAKLNDKPLFPITGHPKALYGYYKFLPENGDTMNINVHLYKNGVEVTSGHFQSDIIISDWMPFQIIFTDTLYTSVDSARISFSPANEPKDGSLGPLGNSVLYIDNVSFDTLITSVANFTNEIPRKFNLNQNYPNPFNSSSVIKYSIPNSSEVTLKIFNTLGEEIETLVNDEKPVGTYEVNWNAFNLPSGVYFYRLQAGTFVQTRKMILLK